MIAKHLCLGVENDISTTGSSGTTFNNTSFAIPKGIYTIAGVNYDCQQEGLHAWYDGLAGVTLYRYVFNSSSYPMTSTNVDPEKFLSAVAYLHVHGLVDDALSLSDKTLRLLNSRLRTSCGPTTEWAELWLGSAFLNFPFRQVSVLTAETPNGVTDGHILFELQIGGVWRLCDADLGCMYKDATTGAYLNLKETIEAAAADNLELAWLADPGVGIDPQPKGTTTFDASAWGLFEMDSPEKVLVWVKRTFQIPGIWNAAKTSCTFYMPPGTSGRQSYVTGLSASYSVVSEATWDATFYP